MGEVARRLHEESLRFAHYRQRHLRQLQQELHAQMLLAVPEQQELTPETLRGYEYVLQSDEECRRLLRRTPSGHTQLVLDLQDLPMHEGYSDVHNVKISHDDSRVAFCMECNGSDRYTAYVRDIASGKLLGSAIEDVRGIEWSPDDRHLVYTVVDDKLRPYKVMSRGMGGDSGGSGGGDVELWSEMDPAFVVEVVASKDGKYMVINSHSKTTSEVRLLDRHAVASGQLPPPVWPRVPGVEYFVEHAHGRLYLLTNALGGDEYALLQAEAAERLPLPAPESLAAVVPAEAGVGIDDVDMFSDWAVLMGRRGARPLLRAVCLASGDTTEVPLPSWATSVTLAGNPDFHSTAVLLAASSPLHPETPMLLDLSLRPLVCRELERQSAQGVTAGAPTCASRGRLELARRLQDDCRTELLWAPSSANGAAAGPDDRADTTSPDHTTRIPVSLTRRRDAAADGSAPLLVRVYGAYGLPFELDYEPALLPLLQRGWTVAVVHVRGGGDCGRGWYKTARRERKHVGVQDLLDGIMHLCSKGYGNPGRVAVEGFSAGGLLAAAALNRQPQLFGAALLRSPFVELLATMQQPQLPLTEAEYEEWGSPAEPQQLAAMQRLCPTLNIRTDTRYPPVLVTASRHDPRIPPVGPLRYAMALRSRQRAGSNGTGGPCRDNARTASLPGKGLVLLLVRDGGHFGQQSEEIQDRALEYSFLLHALGGT